MNAGERLGSHPRYISTPIVGLISRTTADER